MYTRYKTKFGDHPSPDVEPTADQLSGLAQLLKSGSLPYTDFSVFGPHGLRSLRRSVFTSYMLNSATGEWSKKEQPGPDSLQAWEKAFRTFKVSMLLLEAADSERLEGYMEFIKDQHSQFGPEGWGIIYRADVRMRSEFQERIRRKLEESPSFGYTRASPWSAIYASTIRESEFWTREVTTPATLLLARNKSLPGGKEDEDNGVPARYARQGGTPAPASKKNKRKYTGEDNSVWDASLGAYSHNRKGIQVCQKFNKGSCGNGKPQSRCTNNRSHQCNLCLGPHQADKCPGDKKAKN